MAAEKPEESENAHNQDRAANNHQNRAAKYFLESVRSGWQWLRNRDRDTVNATSTVVLAFATVAIFLVAIAQWETAEKTDETLKASQRPWMKYLPLEIIGPLIYEGKVVKTKIRFHLQNAGNSPALHVIPAARLVLNNIRTDAEQRTLCDPFLAKTVEGDQGFVSFPGIEPVTEEREISARSDQMDTSPYLNLLAPPYAIWFTIVSCITYRFSSGGGEAHQTGIIFNLLTTKPATFTPSPDPTAAEIDALAIDPKLGNLQPSDLRLAAWHIGSYAY